MRLRLLLQTTGLREENVYINAEQIVRIRKTNAEFRGEDVYIISFSDGSSLDVITSELQEIDKYIITF